MGSVDYLDRLKGVAPKLLAWEALLKDYPHYRQGHVLLQVSFATAKATDSVANIDADRVAR